MASRSIAWIDDDIDVLDELMEPLRKRGFEIKEFRNYTEAINNIEELRRCDLIFLDILLPPGWGDAPQGDYLGLKLLERLRTDLGVEVPVVILSILADTPEGISPSKLKTLKATSLPKPFHIKDLESEVSAAIGLDD